MMYNIPLEVKSTFTDRSGTKIFEQENIDYNKSIAVCLLKDDAKITLTGVRDKLNTVNIFEPLNKADKYDMIL